jgi:hypothetical protein
MMSRIRMTHTDGATPPNIYSDFDWIRQNEAELLAQYGECCLLVYNKQVIGTGATYQEALIDAESRLEPHGEEITPVRQWIYHRQPFTRLRFLRRGQDA